MPLSDSMKLDDKYRDTNLRLRDEFNRITESTTIPSNQRTNFKRLFYAYELARELFLNFVGEDRFDDQIPFRLKPEPEGREFAGRFFLRALHQIQKRNNFVPWVKLERFDQEILANNLGAHVESIIGGRNISLLDFSPSLRKGNNEMWEMFESYFRRMSASTWLIAEFDLINVDNWDRQFQTWKEQKLCSMGLTSEKAIKRGSESTHLWLDHISRLRILRAADWSVEKADELLSEWKISELRPDRKPHWFISVSKVEEKIKHFFAVEANFT